MRFGLLGTLEVVDDDGRPLELGGAQPRALLAMLLLAGGRVVAVDSIVEALWGDSPPPSAAGTLQSYVSRLRRTLEPGRARNGAPSVLAWEPPGYRLVIDADAVDARRFERLADEGRALLEAGRFDEAAGVLAEADQLWRGPALLDVRDLEVAAGAAARLEERRMLAAEDRFTAELELGRHAAAVGPLTEAVAANPLREGLRAQLALALYRSGRQAEALRSIDEARRTLRDELGIDPGRELRALEARILDHDPALDPPRPATEASPTTTASPRAPIAPAAPAGPGGSTFVGRDREVELLCAALAEATAQSSPRMAVIEGEPGIGKTRLAEELAQRAAPTAIVVWGRCYEGGAAPAFWPWLAALRGVVEQAAVDPGPVLGSLLAPSVDTSVEAQLAPVDAGRFALFEAVAAALAAASADRPVVVILDDLQWADHVSLELLGFLAGATVEGRIVVVATVRELEPGRIDPVVEALAAVARRSSSLRLHLSGLDQTETSALLAAATGQEVDPAAAATIHARAGGNPFYATELARLLGGGPGRLDVAAVSAASVPAGVRDVVRQRLARLPEPTVELLRVASVVGRDADIGVLAGAADREVDRCLDELEPAILQRLLAPVVDQPGTYRFLHALVREVLVDDLSSLRRARLHLRVADAIVERYGDAADAAEIVAEHLWAAAPVGVGRRAAIALDRAADVAIRRMAYEAGEDLLNRAEQLHRSVGAGSHDDAVAELECITHWLAVRRALHGYNALLDEGARMRRARELAERVGRQDVLARLLWAEWAGLDTACELDRSEPLLHELRALAERHESLTTRVMAVQGWGIHCWHLGKVKEASELLDQAASLTISRSGETLAIEFEHEQELLPQPFALYVHDLIGDLPDVPQRFAALSSRQEHPFARAVVQMFASAGALAVGDYDRAVAEAERGLEADPTVAFTFWGCGTRAYLGTALAMTGEVDAGVEMVRGALPRYLDSGARTGLPLFHARLAQALARAGRLPEASEEVAAAEAALRHLTEGWSRPVVMAAAAEVRHHHGDAPADEVGAELRRAVELATSQGSGNVARGIAQLGAELGLDAGLPA